MQRREFLKFSAGALAAAITQPLELFVPPRDPYLQHQDSRGLYSLVSHLGVFPVSRELGICEGKVLEIGDWDGVGYPCLVENACQFGPNPSRVWVYDFDLWNFRHDDELGVWWRHPAGRHFKNHAAWFAQRRFGRDLKEVVMQGGGCLARDFGFV